jgi:hypothetical protein
MWNTIPGLFRIRSTYGLLKVEPRFILGYVQSLVLTFLLCVLCLGLSECVSVLSEAD